MPEGEIYKSFLKKKHSRQKSIALLLDPDKLSEETLVRSVKMAALASVDYIFAGSSTPLRNNLDVFVKKIKASASIPVILFPGNRFQISKYADGVLLLSLISGRNPELLIGQHVMAAHELKESRLEIIPTGYLLIDGGKLASVNYISQTLPVPADKIEIAVSTAIAGEMLGLKVMYLEAGSGAEKTVNPEMIASVRKNISVPLIVGGGIRSADAAENICNAGADIIVVGNAIEDNPELIFEISERVHQLPSAARLSETSLL